MEKEITEMQALLKKQKQRWLISLIVWLIIFIVSVPLLFLVIHLSTSSAAPIYAAILFMAVSFVGMLASPIVEYLVFAHYADAFKDYVENASASKKSTLIATWIIESVYGLSILLLLNAALSSASIMFACTLLDFLLAQAIAFAIYAFIHLKIRTAVAMTIETPIIMALLALSYNYLPESKLIEQLPFTDFTSMVEFVNYASETPDTGTQVFDKVKIKFDEGWSYKIRYSPNPLTEEVNVSSASRIRDFSGYDYNWYYGIFKETYDGYTDTQIQLTEFQLNNTDIGFINFYITDNDLIASVCTTSDYKTVKTKFVVTYTSATIILSVVAIALAFVAFYKKEDKKQSN